MSAFNEERRETLNSAQMQKYIDTQDELMMSCGRNNLSWCIGFCCGIGGCIGLFIFCILWITIFPFTSTVFPAPPTLPPNATVMPTPAPHPQPTPAFNATPVPTPPTPEPTIITVPGQSTFPPFNATPTLVPPGNPNATGSNLGPGNVPCNFTSDCFNPFITNSSYHINSVICNVTTGFCQIVQCSFGFLDCNLNILDGCEVDKFFDSNNCDACQHKCVGPGTDFVACLFGVCSNNEGDFNCSTGFADCNHIGSDYCETNIITDVNNCGGCGVNCFVSGATLRNISGIGTWSCLNYTCNPLTCETGFTNCDFNISNGCEDTWFDPNNCGSCGTKCNNTGFGCCYTGSCVYSAGVNVSTARMHGLAITSPLQCVGIINTTAGPEAVCQAAPSPPNPPLLGCCNDVDCTQAGTPPGSYPLCMFDPAVYSDPDHKICSLAPTPAPTPTGPILDMIALVGPATVNFTAQTPFQFGWDISLNTGTCTFVRFTVAFNTTFLPYLTAPWVVPTLPAPCTAWNHSDTSTGATFGSTCAGSFVTPSFLTAIVNTISFNQTIPTHSSVLEFTAYCTAPGNPIDVNLNNNVVDLLES